MGKGDLKRTLSVEMDLQTSKFDSKLQAVAKKFNATSKEFDGKKILTFDERVIDADGIQKAFNALFSKMEKNFADKNVFKGLSEAAQKERDKIAHMWEKGDFKIPFNSKELENVDKKVGAAVKQITEEYKSLNDVAEKYNEKSRDAVKEADILKKNKQKNNKANRDELNEEMKLLDLRQAALKRIKELEKKTYTNEKTGKKEEAYKANVDSLREYSKMLELVQTIENRMASGKGAKAVGSPQILKDFREFTDSGAVAKVEKLKDVVSEFYTKLSAPINDYNSKKKIDEYFVFDEKDAENFLQIIEKIIPEVAKLKEGAKEAAAETKNTGEAASEAVKKAEEAAAKAAAKVAELTQQLKAAKEAAASFSQKDFDKFTDENAAISAQLFDYKTKSRFDQGIKALSGGTKGFKGESLTDVAKSIPAGEYELVVKQIRDLINEMGSSIGTSAITNALKEIDGYLNVLKDGFNKLKSSSNEALNEADKTLALDKIKSSIDSITQMRTELESTQTVWSKSEETVAALEKKLEAAEAAAVKANQELERVRAEAAKGGSGEGSGGQGGGEGEGKGGSGEHAGPLYSQEDVEASRENLSNTYKDISDIVEKIKSEILTDKLTLNFDSKILTDITEAYTKLSALKDELLRKVEQEAQTEQREGQIQQEASKQSTQASQEEIKAIEAEIAAYKKESDEIRRLIEAKAEYANKSSATKALKGYYEALENSRGVGGEYSKEAVVRYNKAYEGAQAVGVAQSTLNKYFNGEAIGAYNTALEKLRTSFEVVESTIATLETRLAELNGSLSSPAPQQEAAQLDKVEQQANEAAEAVNKLKDAEAGMTGATMPSVPVDVHLDEDAKYVITTELSTLVEQIKGLTQVLIKVGIEPNSITQTVTDIENLIALLKTKGPVPLEARISEESRKSLRAELKTITATVKGPDGKGVPIDIDLSDKSVQNLEDRVQTIAARVNKAIVDSKTIESKAEVNIPVKVNSISKIVGDAVKEYNSSEHPTHLIKLQATITKTALMAKVREAVTEVNTALVDAKSGGVKVPIKTDSSKTLKDSSLKNTEAILDRIKEKYSNLEIKIKIAKDSDVNKIDEVFTKIRDTLNQVNKSGGVKIIYNTNGSGNSVVQHSADEEKALKSLNNELDALIKKYRDFQNTDSLFADKNTKDTQEAIQIREEVEKLYQSLISIPGDTNIQSDANTLSGILDQFSQKLAALKIDAKDTYSSMTGDMKNVSKEAEKDVQAIENLIQATESYRADTKIAATAKLIGRNETGNFEGVYTAEQIKQLEALEAEYLKLQSVVNQVHDAYMKGEDLSGAAEQYDKVKKSVKEMYDAFNSGLKGGSGKGAIKTFVAENIKSLNEAKAAIADYNHALAGIDAKASSTKGGVTTLTYELQEQEGIVRTLKYQYDTVTGSVTAFSDSEKKVLSVGERFNAMLKQRGASLVAYLATFASFYRLVSVMRDGIEVVHEVDTAFTELRKVAQESDDQLKSFANTMAFDIAQSVGSTGKDIINLAADFERLGYSLQESQKLAKDTAIYMNVGDIESSEEAMNSLVSTMKGFRLEAEDSTKIIDEFNEVGNNFAISSAGIGEALERSSAALYQANNSLEESVALVTSANGVIQNPEQVGSALKTVALRIRGRFLCPSIVKAIVHVA